MHDQTPPLQGDAPPQGYPPAQVYPPPQRGGPQYSYPPQKSRSFPVWAIVLIVLAALAIPAMLFAAIAIPMFVNQNEKAKDSQVKEGVHSLQVGVQTYAVDHWDEYPDPSEMTPYGGVGDVVGSWPSNPWTDEPMREGSDPGDFHYDVVVDGGGRSVDYTLEGYLSDGETFRVH